MSIVSQLDYSCLELDPDTRPDYSGPYLPDLPCDYIPLGLSYSLLINAMSLTHRNLHLYEYLIGIMHNTHL